MSSFGKTDPLHGGTPETAGTAAENSLKARICARLLHDVGVAPSDAAPEDWYLALALALRDKADIRAVVLGGAPSGGGAALVSAVTPDSGFDAGELVADGFAAIGGGGKKSPDLTMAGGKEPGGIDTALDALKELLTRVDILVINEEEARQLTGYHHPLAVAEALRAMGPETVIVKRGEYGAHR